MSYTFVKVSQYYSDYLQQYYKKFPETKDKTYQEQYEHLMADAFAWADFLSKGLRQVGVNAHEIVSNAEPLQTAWAKEHGLMPEQDILLAQLQFLKPEVLFLNTFVYEPEYIKFLREKVPSIKQIIGWRAAPYKASELETYRSLDYMLTCTPGFVIDFEAQGIKSYQLNHAFEPSLLDNLPKRDTLDNDLIFIGSLMAGAGYHGSRIQVLENLIKRGLKVGIYGSLYTESAVIDKMKGRMAWALKIPALKSTLLKFKPLIKRLAQTQAAQSSIYPSSILENMHPPVFGMDMYRALAQSKISFNIHIEAAGQYAGNMRLFESTGAGACLLTDWKSNIHDLFEPGTEIVTYRGVDDCIEKAVWLMEHPKECEEIAKRGQARILKEHSFAHRAQQLDLIIRENFK